ncbi:hypothetical protein [Verrucosispora sioxanthis]|uniref:hypothetical protein n=1 Tax=Verrucosispora sioxanthis TaxID=2499994 RepID=UPI001F482840|nr:hypothetical protein [Verrucosispora sioxanthis]
MVAGPSASRFPPLAGRPAGLLRLLGGPRLGVGRPVGGPLLLTRVGDGHLSAGPGRRLAGGRRLVVLRPGRLGRLGLTGVEDQPGV